MILPVVFTDTDDILRVDKTASIVFALFFIGVGYAASSAIALFQRRKKIFLLRSLFLSVFCLLFFTFFFSLSSIFYLK